LEWTDGLQKQEFVATESKIKTIISLLKELEFETNLSNEERVEVLKAQKKEIDQEIKAITDNQDLRFDDRKIKEHFMQIQKSSSELLSDFREIEQNFRTLNQEAKHAIANAQSAKSEVLDEIFEIEDSIRQSNQGKSFYAFWDFLMDINQIDELDRLVGNLYNIPQIQDMDSEKRMENLKYNLLSGGEQSHKILTKLIEQLRRFIDDKLWVENKRILELANSIEKKAITIKENPPNKREFFNIDGIKIKVESIASKQLFAPTIKESFSHELKDEVLEVDLTKLYAQVYVDEQILQQNIKKLLQKESQFTLIELNKAYPIKKGLSELVVYLKIAQNMESAYIEESQVEIVIEDEYKKRKRVRMSNIVFVEGIKRGDRDGDK
jgi:NADH:ubiquinone oxidoreductase subunit E